MSEDGQISRWTNQQTGQVSKRTGQKIDMSAYTQVSRCTCKRQVIRVNGPANEQAKNYDVGPLKEERVIFAGYLMFTTYNQWWAAILKNVSFKAIQIHNF
jgi:hypothetical protein